MKLLLRLKAWQMFMLIIVPMFLPGLVLTSPESFKWFGAFMMVGGVIIFGWIYTVGSESNRRLPESLKKKTVIYNLGFSVAVFYMILMAVFILPNAYLTNQTQPFPVWLVSLHFGSMLGIFYGLWFTAKQFVTLQRGECVKFIDFSGPFFLFWFSPFGVWFLQPKINELFSE